MDLLSRILEVGRGNQFISFTNSDGKRWIVPIRNMRTAMALYQASSIKGTLIKQLLPYVYRFPFIKRVHRFQTIKLTLNPNLEKLIELIFNTSNFEFSIFGGTPSVHQKITIQISNQNAILGYCKLTDNNNIKTIFRHEQFVLGNLQAKKITQIPQCLYCGLSIQNIEIFAQTTCKSNLSKVLHLFTSIHWDFLSNLHDHTKQNIPFEDSDFCKSLTSLKSFMNGIDSIQSEIIKTALAKVERLYKNKEVCFSAYHGDFTPWNMFSEQDKLFVFDFEYAQMTFPPFLDWFHFFTQTSIFEKHLDINRIYENYKVQRKSLVSYFDNPDFAYICYLLAIIELYVTRESGNITKETSLKISQWESLLNWLLNNK